MFASAFSRSCLSSPSLSLTEKQLVKVALSADEHAVVYVQLEEATGQLGPRRVYHVDLQADVGLASRQIDLVPTEVVQRQSAGARHLVLARAQINVNLRQKGGSGGGSGEQGRGGGEAPARKSQSHFYTVPV